MWQKQRQGDLKKEGANLRKGVEKTTESLFLSGMSRPPSTNVSCCQEAFCWVAVFRWHNPLVLINKTRAFQSSDISYTCPVDSRLATSSPTATGLYGVCFSRRAATAGSSSPTCDAQGISPEVSWGQGHPVWDSLSL